MSISVVVWGYVGIISLSVSIVGIGIMDRFLGDDDENPSGTSDASDSTGESLGEAFEDAVSTDADDTMEAMDDPFGGLAEGDDDWGGFEDEGLEELESGGGVDTANLKTRVDELENDIESVSSTISTVRSENEEISRQVTDIQDNVRKLLDIYELVTRGVNPFVEDVEGSPGESGTFGLFEEGADAGASDDPGAVDEAEDFFADDYDNGPSAESADHEVEIERETDVESADDEGMTFEELKAEYDKQRDAWDDDRDLFTGTGASDSDDSDSPPAFEEADVSGDEATPEDEPDPGIDQGEPVASRPEETVAVAQGPSAEEEASVESESEDEGPLVADPDPGTGHGDSGSSQGEGAETIAPDDSVNGSVDKPYLTLLPDGYDAEVLVMEWLAYLVDESSVRETLQAIRYYRNIEWISDAVAEDLRTMLGGVDSGATSARTDGSGLSQLSIEHHQASLAFINHLTDQELRYRSFRTGGRNLGV